MARLFSTESYLLWWGALLLEEGGLWLGVAQWLWGPPLPHTFVGLGGRTALPRVSLALQEGILVVYGAYTLPNISQAALLWLFLALPAEQQVCLPQGSAGARSAGSLGRRCTLPLSALQQLHA